MTPPSEAHRLSRPFTLKAVCFLLVIRSLLVIAVFVLILTGYVSQQEINEISKLGTEAITILYTAMAVVSLIAAVGLWQLRQWAWRLTMLITGMLLVFGLWAQFGGDRALGNAISLLFNIFIVFYLVQGDVRGLFVESSPAEESA